MYKRQAYSAVWALNSLSKFRLSGNPIARHDKWRRWSLPHILTETPLSAYAPTYSDLFRRRASSDHAPNDFDALYREQRGRVESIVRSVVGLSDEIEDLVQATFIEVFRSLDRFEGRSKVSTWVYRVAVNVSLQHLRKRKRKRWLVLATTGDEPERLLAGGDPASRIEDRQVLEMVYEVANTLSDKKRTVWVLHELEGMDPRAISDIVDAPMNTVRSRLLAARKEVMTELRRRKVIPEVGQ